ncbi:MAG: HPr(Ser) kinase/phosphatase [Elusimicrobiota bacterium]
MAISLKRLLDRISEKAKLEFFCCENYADMVKIKCNEINILGLELNGYFEGFRDGQMHVVETKGLKFMSSLSPEQQDNIIAELFSHSIPAIIFVEGNEPDKRILHVAEANNVPVLGSSLSSWGFIRETEWMLDDLLAPRKDHKGTMMEVFGVGVLIRGKSNVGKSECAIDLIHRGHRLIGDDIVEIVKRGNRVLVAQGKYPISNKMELRGIGIVDIVRLYGISAVKEVEKVELIVHLEKWDFEKSYERLGIEEKKKDVMGIFVPYVEIPVASGRNTALLVEVAAMNLRLRKRGIIPAKELDEEVIRSYQDHGEDNKT